MKLWKAICRKLSNNPTQLFSEEGRTITYSEMKQEAATLSERLNGFTCCAILCDSELMAAIAVMGCFAAGVTAVPLSKRYGMEFYERIIDFISPEAIIFDEKGTLKITKRKKSLYIPPKSHPALIMCTSGTTGTPKGVMLSEDGILSNVSDITDYFSFGQKDTILIARPLYHSAVMTGEFLSAIWKGAKIIFYSGPFNPALMLKTIEKNMVTVFCGTPSMVNLMTRLQKTAKEDFPLKHLSVSGECMGRNLCKQIRETFPTVEVYYVYGLTEASPRVSFLPSFLFDKYPGYVGIPLRTVQIKLLDGDGNCVGINKEGLIFVKGKNVMLGYYNNAKQTERVLQNGWLFTGDVGMINSEGLLTVKGRYDDLIIKAGMNIYPQEIENRLKTDRRVKEVLAYGYKDSYGITLIGLKVCGSFHSVHEVKKMCYQLLPSFQIPSKIEIKEQLEKNISGKIKRDSNGRV